MMNSANMTLKNSSVWSTSRKCLYSVGKILIALLRDVPTNFEQEFSKNIYQNHKVQKIRESLFIFRLRSVDVPSIWRIFWENISNILTSRIIDFLQKSLHPKLVGTPCISKYCVSLNFSCCIAVFQNTTAEKEGLSVNRISAKLFLFLCSRHYYFS